MIYNRLVAASPNTQQRFLILMYNSVSILCRSYLKQSKVTAHEKEVFENVTEARAQVGQAGHGADGGRAKAEGMLGLWWDYLQLRRITQN